MNKITDQQLNEYFRQIKLLLPVHSKAEKRFLKDMRSAAEEYIEDQLNCTYDDFIDHFMEPKDAVTVTFHRWIR